MANEINELQAIRNAVSSIALSVEKLGSNIRKTQTQMTALRAVLGTVLVRGQNMTPESAVRFLDQAESIACSKILDTDSELPTIEAILKNLQSGNLGKA